MHSQVCVIGTVFIDCNDFAIQSYHPSTRNIGNIQFVHGGVGRNVAKYLANLHLLTTFVTSVDDPAIGREVVERLQKLKVNIEPVNERPSSGNPPILRLNWI